MCRPIAHLSYGVHFEEDFEFPWDDGLKYEDIDDWWRDVNGYVSPFEYPYDSYGEYKPGFSRDSKAVDDYHTHRYEWMKANPMPVDVIEVGSDDSCSHILTTAGMWGDWETVETVDPVQMRLMNGERQRLLDFMEKYGIETDDEPRWLLSAYSG